jgi:hypothetical protein
MTDELTMLDDDNHHAETKLLRTAPKAYVDPAENMVLMLRSA